MRFRNVDMSLQDPPSLYYIQGTQFSLADDNKTHVSFLSCLSRPPSSLFLNVFSPLALLSVFSPVLLPHPFQFFLAPSLASAFSCARVYVHAMWGGLRRPAVHAARRRQAARHLHRLLGAPDLFGPRPVPRPLSLFMSCITLQACRTVTVWRVLFDVF